MNTKMHIDSDVSICRAIYQTEWINYCQTGFIFRCVHQETTQQTSLFTPNEYACI